MPVTNCVYKGGPMLQSQWSNSRGLDEEKPTNESVVLCCAQHRSRQGKRVGESRTNCRDAKAQQRTGEGCVTDLQGGVGPAVGQLLHCTQDKTTI